MPIAALIPAAVGLIQAFAGGAKARRNEKLLEGMKSPTYTPSKGIMDYYNEAYRRYTTDPLQTRQYKMDAQNIQRSVAQGLGALQDRRSGVSGVNKLVQMQNDALLQSGAIAENEKNKMFGVLGQAAQMKAGEEQRAFQQNKLYPYENKFNLTAQKAAQGANTFNQGISNMGNSIMNYAMLRADQKLNSDPNKVSVGRNLTPQDTSLAYTYSPGMVGDNMLNRYNPSYNVMQNNNRFIGPQLYR